MKRLLAIVMISVICALLFCACGTEKAVDLPLNDSLEVSESASQSESINDEWLGDELPEGVAKPDRTINMSAQHQKIYNTALYNNNKDYSGTARENFVMDFDLLIDMSVTEKKLGKTEQTTVKTTTNGQQVIDSNDNMYVYKNNKAITDQSESMEWISKETTLRTGSVYELYMENIENDVSTQYYALISGNEAKQLEAMADEIIKKSGPVGGNEMFGLDVFQEVSCTETDGTLSVTGKKIKPEKLAVFEKNFDVAIQISTSADADVTIAIDRNSVEYTATIVDGKLVAIKMKYTFTMVSVIPYSQYSVGSTSTTVASVDMDCSFSYDEVVVSRPTDWDYKNDIELTFVQLLLGY